MSLGRMPIAVVVLQLISGPVRSEQPDMARQVTGAPQHLQAIADGHVAGSGAWVGIAPVEPANGSSYPAGTGIVGNTISVGDVPQWLWFEIQLGGWGGRLGTYQISVDQTTFGNGIGSDLARPEAFCTLPGRDGDRQCEAVYGPGSNCTDGLCDIGFQDATNPRFALNGISAVSQTYLAFGSTLLHCGWMEPDDGAPWYGGDLVLTAPDGALGRYHLGVRTNSSTFFVRCSGGEIQIAEYREAIVQIRSGRCCNLTEQVCVDDLTEGACDGWAGRTRWDENAACAAIDCVPTDGACCDRRPGVGGVCWLAEPDQCPDDPFTVYTFNADCEDVTCSEVTGACCEQIDGACTEGVVADDCRGGTDAWFPDESCGAIQCPPDFALIPAVSEWGLVVLVLGLLVVVKVFTLHKGRRDVT